MASTSGLNESPIAWLKDSIMLMEIIAGQFKAEVSSLLNDYVLKFESDMSKFKEIQSRISEAVIRKLEEMVKTNVLKMNELVTEVYEECMNRFDLIEGGTPGEAVPSEETKQAVSEALKELKMIKTEEDDCSGNAGHSQVENEKEKIFYILVTDSDDDCSADDHPNLRRSYYFPQPSSPFQDNPDESNDSLQDVLARDRILKDLESESEWNEDEMEEQTQEAEQVMVKQEVNDDMVGHEAVEPFHHNNMSGKPVMMVKQEVSDGKAFHDQAVAGHQPIHLFHLNNNPGDRMTAKRETDDSMADSKSYIIDDSNEKTSTPEESMDCIVIASDSDIDI